MGKKRKNKHQKRQNLARQGQPTKKVRKEEEGLNASLYHWFQKHFWIKCCLFLGWLILSGVFFYVCLYPLVSKNFQNFDLILPLFVNVLIVFEYPIYKFVDELVTSVCEFFMDMFQILYWVNGLGFIMHNTVGIPGKHGSYAPPLYTLVDQPIWFPNAIYIVCFVLSVGFYHFLKGTYRANNK